MRSRAMLLAVERFSGWAVGRSAADGRLRADAAPLNIVNKSLFDWWAAQRTR